LDKLDFTRPTTSTRWYRNDIRRSDYSILRHAKLDFQKQHQNKCFVHKIWCLVFGLVRLCSCFYFHFFLQDFCSAFGNGPLLQIQLLRGAFLYGADIILFTEWCLHCLLVYLLIQFFPLFISKGMMSLVHQKRGWGVILYWPVLLYLASAFEEMKVKIWQTISRTKE